MDYLFGQARSSHIRIRLVRVGRPRLFHFLHELNESMAIFPSPSCIRISFWHFIFISLHVLLYMLFQLLSILNKMSIFRNWRFVVIHCAHRTVVSRRFSRRVLIRFINKIYEIKSFMKRSKPFIILIRLILLILFVWNWTCWTWPCKIVDAILCL